MKRRSKGSRNNSSRSNHKRRGDYWDFGSLDDRDHGGLGDLNGQDNQDDDQLDEDLAGFNLERWRDDLKERSSHRERMRSHDLRKGILWSPPQRARSCEDVDED